MQKIVIRLALVLIAGVLIYLALRPQPVLVDTALVQEGSMRVDIRDEARWQVRELYVVSAPSNGQLLRVHVDPGDVVAQGDPLAWLAPSSPDMLNVRSRSQAQARVRNAEAALALAEARFAQTTAELTHARAHEKRAIETARKGSLAEADLEHAQFERRSAETAVATAAAAIDMAKAELDNARALLLPFESASQEAPPTGVIAIPAPIDGQVLRVLVESSQSVSAGTPILEFGDPAQMEVVAELLSSDAVRIRAGASVQLDDTFSGSSNDARAPILGTVERIEPYGFTNISALGVEEQRVRVHIQAEQQPRIVGHGYRTWASITTWQKDSVLQVPLGALFRENNRWNTYVITNQRAYKQPLTIGNQNDQFAEVLSGLAPGATVIMHPSEGITDGIRVQIY